MLKQFISKLTLFFRKKNPFLASKFRRRPTNRHFNQAVVRVWNSIYERTGLEKVLQPTSRGTTPFKILEEAKRVVAGGTKGKTGLSSEEEEKRIKEIEKIKKKAKFYQSSEFKEFVSFLQELEQADLEELVKLLYKSERLDNNEYSFLLRGRLEVYERIRDEVEKIISLEKEYAIQD